MPEKVPKQTDSLDSTIELVEQLTASERRKRQRLIFLSCAAIVLISSVIGAYVWTNGMGAHIDTVSYMVFPAEKYQEAAAFQYLEQENQALILADRELNQFDTIWTPEAYQMWVANYGAAYNEVSLNSSAWLTSEQSDSSSSDDSISSDLDIETTEEKELSPFKPRVRLVLSGKREAGSPIRFTIQPYNPQYKYVLDFGNGFSQKSKKRAIYRFDETGLFTVTLKVQNGDGQEAIVAQRVRINPKPKPIEEVVAERSASDESQQKPEPNLSNNIDSTPVTSTQPTPTSQLADNQHSAPGELGIARDEALNEGTSLAVPEARLETTPTSALSPLKVAEVMPAYPGGSGKMFAFLKNNMVYPDIARTHQVEGKIYIQFVVQADGRHTDHRIARGIGYGCDKEAMRVVKQMPDWIPGEQGGQKVPVIYTIPVTFALE